MKIECECGRSYSVFMESCEKCKDIKTACDISYNVSKEIYDYIKQCRGYDPVENKNIVDAGEILVFIQEKYFD